MTSYDRAPDASTTLVSGLDMAVQRAALDAHLRKQQYEARLCEWRATAASKADHKAMLQLLIMEAHRRSPARWPKERCRELIVEMHRMMTQGGPRGSDAYATVLGELSQLRLFDSDGK